VAGPVIAEGHGTGRFAGPISQYADFKAKQDAGSTRTAQQTHENPGAQKISE